MGLFSSLFSTSMGSDDSDEPSMSGGIDINGNPFGVTDSDDSFGCSGGLDSSDMFGGGCGDDDW